MIVFECPSCKTKLQVAEQHAGATIQCPTCKAMASAPKSADIAPIPVTLASAPPTGVTTPEVAEAAKAKRQRDDEDDDADDRPRRARRPDDSTAPKVAAGMGIGLILAIVFGVGCCVIVPIMVALLVPAVQKVREAAARTQSTNNLKQIALAGLSFNDTNKRLPFNGSDQQPAGAAGTNYAKVAKGGNSQSGSWGFQILPYVDQAPMFNAVDRFSGVPAYMCPGRSRPMTETPGGAWSDYFYNNYLNNSPVDDKADNPARPDNKRTMVAITDGVSNTVFAGHGTIATTQYQQSANVTLSTNIFDGGTFGTARAGNAGQVSPTGVLLARDSAAAPGKGSWGGPFPQGALVCMCDGTVRMVPYSFGRLNELLTPAGNEAVLLPD